MMNETVKFELLLARRKAFRAVETSESRVKETQLQLKYICEEHETNRKKLCDLELFIVEAGIDLPPINSHGQVRDVALGRVS